MARKNFDPEVARGLLAAVNDAIARYQDFTGRSAVSDVDLDEVLRSMQDEEALKGTAREAMDALFKAGEQPSVFGGSDHEQEYNYWTFRDQVTDAVDRVGLYRGAGDGDE